jgi:FkbM family methyltransferase
MNSFIDRLEIRNVDILGENDWHWVKDDVGCFGDATDGPMRDWIDGHSEAFFKYLKNTHVVVTGGTSCGMYARFYAKRFGIVYAFEPDPVSFHCMVNNTPYENVVKFQAALGHRHQLIDVIRQDPTNIGTNRVQEKAQNGFIPMIPIDSLNLFACDLIQLDVEGFERMAIRGADETIKKFKPVITAERFVTEGNQAFMAERGYKLVEVSFLDAIYIPVE